MEGIGRDRHLHRRGPERGIGEDGISGPPGDLEEHSDDASEQDEAPTADNE
ncbi:MAG: hypothetical protein ACFB9N_00605 [Geitlerinemataceae cyanobacterium]